MQRLSEFLQQHINEIIMQLMTSGVPPELMKQSLPLLTQVGLASTVALLAGHCPHAPPCCMCVCSQGIHDETTRSALSDAEVEPLTHLMTYALFDSADRPRSLTLVPALFAQVRQGGAARSVHGHRAGLHAIQHAHQCVPFARMPCPRRSPGLCVAAYPSQFVLYTILPNFPKLHQVRTKSQMVNSFVLDHIKAQVLLCCLPRPLLHSGW